MTKFQVHDVVRFKGLAQLVFEVVAVNDYSDLTYELVAHDNDLVTGRLDWVEGSLLEHAEPPREYQAINNHVSDRLDEIEENLKNG